MYIFKTNCTLFYLKQNAFRYSKFCNLFRDCLFGFFYKSLLKYLNITNNYQKTIYKY